MVLAAGLALAERERVGEFAPRGPVVLWYSPPIHASWRVSRHERKEIQDPMGNSKTLGVARKHRRRQRAAKERMHQHLNGKLDADKLPELARSYLRRHLRVVKRG
jgi:hypothetical protein